MVSLFVVECYFLGGVFGVRRRHHEAAGGINSPAQWEGRKARSRAFRGGCGSLGEFTGRFHLGGLVVHC